MLCQYLCVWWYEKVCLAKSGEEKMKNQVLIKIKLLVLIFFKKMCGEGV